VGIFLLVFFLTFSIFVAKLGLATNTRKDMKYRINATKSTDSNPKPDARKTINAWVNGRPQGNWRETQGNKQDLIDLINQGYAYSFNCVTWELNGTKPQYSLKECWGFGIDIDSGIKQDWREIPEFLLSDAAFIHRSPSYKQETKKYRLLYFFNEPISDFNSLKDILIYRMQTAGIAVDESCKDVTRFFYGNRFGDAGVEFCNLNRTVNVSEELSKARSYLESKKQNNAPRRAKREESMNNEDNLTTRILTKINDFFRDALAGDIDSLYPGWQLEAKPVAIDEGMIAKWHCSNPFSETNSSKTSLSITWYDNGLPPVFSDRGIEGRGGSCLDWFYLQRRDKLNPKTELPLEISTRSWNTNAKDFYKFHKMGDLDLRQLTRKAGYDREELAAQFWKESNIIVVANGITTYWHYEERLKYWHLINPDTVKCLIQNHLTENTEDVSLLELESLGRFVSKARLKYGESITTEELLSKQQFYYNFTNGILVNGELREHDPKYFCTMPARVSYIPSEIRKEGIKDIAFKVFSTYFPYDNDAQIIEDFAKLIVHGKQHVPQRYLAAFGQSGSGKSACLSYLHKIFYAVNPTAENGFSKESLSSLAGKIASVDKFSTNTFLSSQASKYHVMLVDEAQYISRDALAKLNTDITEVDAKGAIRSINEKFQPVHKVVVPQLLILTAESAPFRDSVTDGEFRRMIQLKPHEKSLAERGLLEGRFWEKLEESFADWISYLADCYSDCQPIIGKYFLLDPILDKRNKETQRNSSDHYGFIEDRIIFDSEGRMTRDELVEAYIEYSYGKPAEMVNLRENDRRAILVKLSKMIVKEGAIAAQFREGDNRPRGFKGVRLAKQDDLKAFEMVYEVKDEPQDAPQESKEEETVQPDSVQVEIDFGDTAIDSPVSPDPGNQSNRPDVGRRGTATGEKATKGFNQKSTSKKKNILADIDPADMEEIDFDSWFSGNGNGKHKT
jgi:hypothetical protein